MQRISVCALSFTAAELQRVGILVTVLVLSTRMLLLTKQVKIRRVPAAIGDIVNLPELPVSQVSFEVIEGKDRGT